MKSFIIANLAALEASNLWPAAIRSCSIKSRNRRGEVDVLAEVETAIRNVQATKQAAFGRQISIESANAEVNAL